MSQKERRQQEFRHFWHHQKQTRVTLNAACLVSDLNWMGCAWSPTEWFDVSFLSYPPPTKNSGTEMSGRRSWQLRDPEWQSPRPAILIIHLPLRLSEEEKKKRKKQQLLRNTCTLFSQTGNRSKLCEEIRKIACCPCLWDEQTQLGEKRKCVKRPGATCLQRGTNYRVMSWYLKQKRFVSSTGSRSSFTITSKR